MMIILINFVMATEFGYNRLPDTNELGSQSNITTNIQNATVNNSLFWNGYAFDLNRWLLIDGSNANQNININPYNITANYFIGDGSGLTNLPLQNFSYPHNQDLNTTDNVTFFNLSLNNLTAVGVKAEIGNFTELYTSNGTLHIGNVSMSSNNDTLNIKSGQGVNASFFVGDGSKLTNLNLTNVSIDGGQVNATNFTGDNFFGGIFHGSFNWTTLTDWLNFDGSILSFNESKLNQTAEVTKQSVNTLVTTSSGTGSNVSVYTDFLITQITVTPNNPTTQYKFEAYETTTGNIIDRNRKKHTGVWDIYKNHAINDTVTFNITNSNPDDTFTIKLTYLDNFQ